MENMESTLDIEYNKEQIWDTGSEYYEHAPVYLDGLEIGVVTLTDEILEGKYTGRTLYLFYPHDTPDKGYEASTCEQAVCKYLHNIGPAGSEVT